MTEVAHDPQGRDCPAADKHLHIMLDGWTRSKLFELAHGSTAKAVITALVNHEHAERQKFMRQSFNSIIRGGEK